MSSPQEIYHQIELTEYSPTAARYRENGGYRDNGGYVDSEEEEVETTDEEVHEALHDVIVQLKTLDRFNETIGDDNVSKKSDNIVKSPPSSRSATSNNEEDEISTSYEDYQSHSGSSTTTPSTAAMSDISAAATPDLSAATHDHPDLIVPVKENIVAKKPHVSLRTAQRGSRAPLLKDCSMDSGRFSASFNSDVDPHHIQDPGKTELNDTNQPSTSKQKVHKAPPTPPPQKKCCSCLDDLQIIMIVKLVCWTGVIIFTCLEFAHVMANKDDEIYYAWWRLSVQGYTCTLAILTLVIDIVILVCYSTSKLNFNLKCTVALLILYNCICIMAYFAVIAIWFPIPVYTHIDSNFVRLYLVFAGVGLGASSVEISYYVDDIKRLSEVGCWSIVENTMTMCSPMVL